MDLSLAEEQEALKQSVRSLLGDRFPTASLRLCEKEPDRAAEIYRDLAGLGLGGILVEEARGGLGLGLAEMVVAQEELGSALVPLLYGVGITAGASLLGACPGAEADAWLGRLIAGEVLLACAFGDGASAGLAFDPAGPCISGDAGFVIEPGLAGGLLLLAGTGADAALCLIDPAGPGLRFVDLPNLADQAAAQVRLDGAPVLAVLARGAAAVAAWDRAVSLMRVALAAQAVGGAQRSLTMACDYASTRTQFGQPIGGFQAIAHLLAEAAVNVAGARILAFRAAAAADEGEDLAVWADLAKLKACQTFRDVSAMCIQVHGGIGFTLEADPQLYYRRAKFLQLMLGSPLDLQESAGAALLAGDHKVLEA